MRLTRISSALLLFIFISEFHRHYGLLKRMRAERSIDEKESPSEPIESFYREIKKNELGIRALGVVGVNEKTKEEHSFKSDEELISHEVDKMFQHIKIILDKHGTSFKRVATYIFYVNDKKHYDVIEATLKHYSSEPLPGRQMIVSENLPKGIHVECEFVAFTTNKTLDRRTCLTMEVP